MYHNRIHWKYTPPSQEVAQLPLSCVKNETHDRSLISSVSADTPIMSTRILHVSHYVTVYDYDVIAMIGWNTQDEDPDCNRLH